MEKFKGKLAVVTGASSGIGEAIAKELLKTGVNVAGLGRNMAILQTIAREVSTDAKYTGKFHALQCDITKENEIERTFRKITDDIGPIWILVNNAGGGVNSLLYEATSEALDDSFAYTFGTLLCSKETLKSMVENSIAGGHIVNICSIVDPEVFVLYPEMKPVICAKVVQRTLSDGLRREVVKKKLNVKITEINPAYVRTRLTDEQYPAEEYTSTKILEPVDVAKSCMAVLSTPSNVMVTELTIRPVHDVFTL